jgi:hypothetical protein
MFWQHLYVLFFIEHGFRHAHLRASSITPGAWVTQQARNLLVNPERSGRRPEVLDPRPGRQVHRGVGHGIHGHRHSDHQDPVQAPKMNDGGDNTQPAPAFPRAALPGLATPGYPEFLSWGPQSS